MEPLRVSASSCSFQNQGAALEEGHDVLHLRVGSVWDPAPTILAVPDREGLVVVRGQGKEAIPYLSGQAFDGTYSGLGCRIEAHWIECDGMVPESSRPYSGVARIARTIKVNSNPRPNHADGTEGR